MSAQHQPPTEDERVAPRATQTAGNGIEDRVLELLRAHIPFNDAVDEIGGELVLMFQCECQPSLTTEYKTADEWATHVASVLVSELGLTEESAVGGHGNEPLATDPRDVAVIKRFRLAKPLRRYVTSWEPA